MCKSVKLHSAMPGSPCRGIALLYLCIDVIFTGSCVCTPPSDVEIRRQLNDQQVCLDLRTEGKLSLLSDFQEFFRKRGELELEYARSLDKLVDRFERLAKQRNPRFVWCMCLGGWMSLT